MVDTLQDTSVPTESTRSLGDRVRGLLAVREVGVLTALIVLAALGVMTADGFATTTNALNVGQQVSQIGIMAVGATFVILAAEIDLSVGSIYALGAVLTGLQLQAGSPLVVAILAGAAAGAIAGLINGLATVYLRIPSFIVTLGSLSAVRGFTLLITDGGPVSVSGNPATVDAFTFLGRGTVLGIPMQLVAMLVVFAVAIVVLRTTRFGFHVYAVGGNKEAARLCGLPVNRVRVTVFVISGTVAAFAGIIGFAFLGMVQGVTGTGLELIVISAVIIGGTALFGGSGTLTGTLVGVVLIGVLQNILVLVGLSSFWQTLIVGVVIVLAVALDTLIRNPKTTAA